ncbi:hypothetical protein QTN25_001784 [Entamoeba marina]
MGSLETLNLETISEELRISIERNENCCFVSNNMIYDNCGSVRNKYPIESYTPCEFDGGVGCFWFTMSLNIITCVILLLVTIMSFMSIKIKNKEKLPLLATR